MRNKILGISNYFFPPPPPPSTARPLLTLFSHFFSKLPKTLLLRTHFELLHHPPCFWAISDEHSLTGFCFNPRKSNHRRCRWFLISCSFCCNIKNDISPSFSFCCHSPAAAFPVHELRNTHTHTHLQPRARALSTVPYTKPVHCLRERRERGKRRKS